MKHTLTFSTLAFLVLTVFSFGCATPKVASGAALNDTWTLEQALSEGSLKAIPAGVKAPELTFAADGNLSGFTAVNRLSASWRADSKNKGITISQAVTTRMAGLSMEANNMENIFLTRLNEVQTYDLEDSKLLLKGGAGQVLLVFTKTK
jgi:heat shock protein HslJ